LSKAQYIASRYPSTPSLIRASCRKFIALFPLSEGYRITFEIEECLWSTETEIDMPLKSRHEIARALERCALFADFGRFLQGLEKLFPIKSRSEDFLNIISSTRSQNPVVQHMLRNDDWTAWDLFEYLNAFEVSSRRFVQLIELLMIPEIHTSEERQGEIVKAIAPCIQALGLELTGVAQDSGYSIYALANVRRGVKGRPKNIIFASRCRPDIRFRDAISNDIELVSGADDVLVFDRPIPKEGVTWSDLLSWWAEKHGLDPALRETRRRLYARLWSCLPDESPPQQMLFETYYRVFRETIDARPALLPEVWLLYDPKTLKERGKDALLNQRMDFVLLLPHQTRVVIEVDGKQHYSNKDGSGSPTEYAKMMRADRDLRLQGYEIFRFGASELLAGDAKAIVRDFFLRLFSRHRVT